MTNSLNNFTFTGFVGQDPTFNSTANGNQVANVSVALSSYDWKEKETLTDWVKVSVWGKKAEYIDEHCTKGCMVAVCGSLSLRHWVDREDVEHTELSVNATDVVIVQYPPKAERAVSRKEGDKVVYDAFVDDDDDLDLDSDESPAQRIAREHPVTKASVTTRKRSTPKR